MSSNFYPLKGFSLALTRPTERSDELGASLQALGAEVHSLPTIVIHYLCPELNEHLDKLLTSSNPRSLALVSAEATRAFHSYLTTSYPNTQIPSWNHIFSIGEKTQATARELGFQTAQLHLASPSNDVGLRTIIRKTVDRGESVVAPRGNRARVEWSQSLSQEGFNILRPCVYQIQDAVRCEHQIPKHIDIAIFFSPSAVDAWFRLYGNIDVGACAVIGRTTAKACEQAGLKVGAIASSPTEPALLESLKNYVSTLRS